MLDLIRDIILATDLAHHLRIFKDLQKMADGTSEHISMHSHVSLLLLCTHNHEQQEEARFRCLVLSWDSKKDTVLNMIVRLITSKENTVYVFFLSK